MPKNGRKKRGGRGHSGRPPEVVLRTNGTLYMRGPKYAAVGIITEIERGDAA